MPRLGIYFIIFALPLIGFSSPKECLEETLSIARQKGLTQSVVELGKIVAKTKTSPESDDAVSSMVETAINGAFKKLHSAIGKSAVTLEDLLLIAQTLEGTLQKSEANSQTTDEIKSADPFEGIKDISSLHYAQQGNHIEARFAKLPEKSKYQANLIDSYRTTGSNRDTSNIALGPNGLMAVASAETGPGGTDLQYFIKILHFDSANKKVNLIRQEPLSQPIRATPLWVGDRLLALDEKGALYTYSFLGSKIQAESLQTLQLDGQPLDPTSLENPLQISISQKGTLAVPHSKGVSFYSLNEFKPGVSAKGMYPTPSAEKFYDGISWMPGEKAVGTSYEGLVRVLEQDSSGNWKLLGQHPLGKNVLNQPIAFGENRFVVAGPFDVGVFEMQEGNLQKLAQESPYMGAFAPYFLKDHTLVTGNNTGREPLVIRFDEKTGKSEVQTIPGARGGPAIPGPAGLVMLNEGSKLRFFREGEGSWKEVANLQPGIQIHSIAWGEDGTFALSQGNQVRVYQLR